MSQSTSGYKCTVKPLEKYILYCISTEIFFLQCQEENTSSRRFLFVMTRFVPRKASASHLDAFNRPVKDYFFYFFVFMKKI